MHTNIIMHLKPAQQVPQAPQKQLTSTQNGFNHKEASLNTFTTIKL